MNKNNDHFSKSKKQKTRENFKVWVSYWRSNPHRFVSEYLKISSFSRMQKILIFLFFRFNYIMLWASRGIGKSYLIALYALVRCILYPDTKVIIASGTKSQAVSIISEKIASFMNESKFVANEILDRKDGINAPKVLFKNGSTIKVVAANDNARSNRGNVLIIDEFRLVNHDIIKTVLAKFLTSNRRPPYMNKKEYKDVPSEHNTEIYLSSAWYKYHWSYRKFLSYLNSMVQNKPYLTFGIPYPVGIEEGILNKQRIIDEMAEDDFDSVKFDMEMKCLPYGESSDAFFSYNELNECRKIKKPMNSLSYENWIKYGNSNKNNPLYIAKHSSEIRILCVDIALMGGIKNDSTSFILLRLIPGNKGYMKYVPYIKTIEGQHTSIQTVMMKRLFYDFECDYVVLDTNGNGMSIYDDAVKITEDEERGTEYPAWTAFNNDAMDERSVFDDNAVPVIYSMKVTGQGSNIINHEMAVYFRENVRNKTISFLINEIDGESFAKRLVGTKKLSPDTDKELEAQYFLTTRMINELISLDMVIVGGYIKLKEPSGQRKDRYSALSYGLYFTKSLEAELLSTHSHSDDDDWVEVLSAEAGFYNKRKMRR